MNPGSQIAGDERLPGLLAALDGERMRGEFDAALFGAEGAGRYRVDDCRVERVRYKAGQKCVLCYRLQITDTATGRSSSPYVSARVFPRGQSASRYRKALSQPLVRPKAGLPVAVLPELDMVAWNFPNERKLAGLPALAEPRGPMVECLEALARERFGRASRVVGVIHRIVHYVPEHTCTARVDLAIDDGGSSRTWTVFGKTFQDDEGARVFRLMRRLADACEPASVLRLPTALAWKAGSRTLWQEGLAGDTLAHRFPDAAPDAGTQRRIASAIASLHATAIVGLRQADMIESMAEIRARAALIARSMPQLQSELDDLVDALDARAPTGVRFGTLHGDLHPGNVFLQDDAIALIDLDAVHRGPVLADLASWGAGAIYRALLAGRDAGTEIDHYHDFADAYANAAGCAVDRREADWFLAAMLLTERCARAVSRLKAGRLELVGTMLQLAAALAPARRPGRAAAGVSR